MGGISKVDVARGMGGNDEQDAKSIPGVVGACSVSILCRPRLNNQQLLSEERKRSGWGREEEYKDTTGTQPKVGSDMPGGDTLLYTYMKT